MRANGWQLCEKVPALTVLELKKMIKKSQITRHWQWTDKTPLKAEQREEHLKLKKRQR